MVTMDVKEIVKQAAQQEDKAYKFYMDALKFVKDPAYTGMAEGTCR